MNSPRNFRGRPSPSSRRVRCGVLLLLAGKSPLIHTIQQKCFEMQMLGENWSKMESAPGGPSRGEMTCEATGKVRYRHRETASNACRAMTKKGYGGMTPYECEECGGWHIGHKHTNLGRLFAVVGRLRRIKARSQFLQRTPPR